MYISVEIDIMLLIIMYIMLLIVMYAAGSAYHDLLE